MVVQHDLFLALLDIRVNSITDIDQLGSNRRVDIALARLLNLCVTTNPPLMGIECVLLIECRSVANCAPTSNFP